MIADPSDQDGFGGVHRRQLADSVPSLPAYRTERERTVIRGRFGLGRRDQTLREVGPTLSLSAERVRQIEQDALNKLQTAALGQGGPLAPTRRLAPGVRVPVIQAA